MAEETTITAEPSLEQELDALFNPPGATPAPESDKGATPEADKAPSSPPPPGEAAPETKPEGETDPLLAALDGIKEDTPPEEPAKPALTSEQQQILAAVPDVKTVEYLRQVHTAQENIQNTLERGSMDEVESMFKEWNPSAYDRLLENIYDKYVASGQWVDRFITETESGGNNKAVRALQQQVNDLKKQVTEKSTVSAKQQAEEAQKKAFAGYGLHINGLLDQIKFSEADRPFVIATLNARVAQDPALVAAIQNGDFAKVNKTFKATIKDYVTRDKQVTNAKAAQIAEQEKKKAPVGGGAATPENVLPDDIRQVPKGQEESWMDQQLGKLARLVGKK